MRGPVMVLGALLGGLVGLKLAEDYRVSALAGHSVADTFRHLSATIIMQSPALALKNDLHTQLWRLGIYRVLQPYRSRLETLRVSKAGRARQDSLASTHFSDSDLYQRLLDVATGVLIRIVRHLRVTFIDGTAQLLATGLDPSVPTPDEKHAARLIAFQLLIHLGDTARYHEALGHAPATTSICSYYFEAIRLQPSNGHPFNQLAVVFIGRNDRTTAVFCYMRSMLTAEPFSTVRENFHRLANNIQNQVTGCLDEQGEWATRPHKLMTALAVLMAALHHHLDREQGAVHQLQQAVLDPVPWFTLLQRPVIGADWLREAQAAESPHVLQGLKLLLDWLCCHANEMYALAPQHRCFEALTAFAAAFERSLATQDLTYGPSMQHQAGILDSSMYLPEDEALRGFLPLVDTFVADHEETWPQHLASRERLRVIGSRLAWLSQNLVVPDHDGKARLFVFAAREVAPANTFTVAASTQPETVSHGMDLDEPEPAAGAYEDGPPTNPDGRLPLWSL
ncbi:uncharacterized protein MONBRDRAFT_33077 [Monosiga brevicollis MX1]|uniref:DNA/RNA-binding domain-containing protein n=1 Tax=Monosiga brevicollis TaxID=81824 RepID=A9V3E0_MONBE|nr:uncharacterized protein MONBRDRAFT_33077 [Monosiga brevicollis MX1]EDQ88043.1 predicted protein [Monosiga brevicollis MX1]|eukprot:XP_001747119.1 hypothetical protein [Monosiga brevicollis MX1]